MFWRGVVGYLPVQVISAIVGFGTLVVFTRLLSPHEFGQYALAFSVGRWCRPRS
jgi:O-antigen/teichoic acid export membrane protein